MTKVLGGGSKSSSKSGYSALSKELQNSFNPLGVAVGQYTNPNNPGVIDAFTPMAQTADETAAFDAMRGGFTPTQESLTADIGMQMNPYNQFVIDQINREAGGNYSILKEALGSAGQMGSNRQLLGANDIDLTRTGQIGQFLQGQFNTSLNNAMNVLPGQRQNDASNLMQIGAFERGLDTQTKQAPIAALQAGTGMIGPFTAGGTQSSSSNPGLMQSLGPIANMAGAAMMMSDIRAKENIKKIGIENGFNVYRYNYKGGAKEYIGVMAQEVEKTRPDAVKEIDGLKCVNYEKIGVKFREFIH